METLQKKKLKHMNVVMGDCEEYRKIKTKSKGKTGQIEHEEKRFFFFLLFLSSLFLFSLFLFSFLWLFPKKMI